MRVRGERRDWVGAEGPRSQGLEIRRQVKWVNEGLQAWGARGEWSEE